MSWRWACLTVWMLILSSGAEAIPLRVVTATELQIEPRVAADRGSVTFALHLQDDRRAPLDHRAIRLQVTASPGRIRDTREVMTDRSGEATVTLPLTPADRSLAVVGEFAGDRSASPASQSLRVSPDAPFVTLELSLDPVINLGTTPVPAVVTVHVGQVVPVSAGELSVDLVVGDHTIATGMTDASGRAALEIPAAELGEPGVRRVRPRVSLGADMVVGPERNLVVRAHTALTLVRSSLADAQGRVLLVGALSTTRAPVRDAPIRVMFGPRALAGARTDSRGTFAAWIPQEVLVEHDVSVRAVFDPTEPWFEGATSPIVTLTDAAPAKIGWGWLLSPLVFAALGVAGFWLRSLRKTPVVAPPRPVTTGVGEPTVERLSALPDGGVRVRLRVVDHATGKAVAGAFVRLSPEGEWSPLGEDALALSSGRRMAFEVGAEGFAPKVVEGQLPGPGEYAVRVALKSWREALFDRARAWLGTVAGVTAQTPREALAGATRRQPAAVALVELVETGCYGPEAPGQREVVRADELIAALRAPSAGDPGSV